MRPPLHDTMPSILIVAYGNPLRSDDGVAWRAADALGGKFPESDVEIVCLHQLAPELAETVSHFAKVIFIDAGSEPACVPGEIRVQQIHDEAGDSTHAAPFSHTPAPATVLALASRLYGATPRAFTVTVAGGNFGHGQTLSPAVASALPRVISQIESLVRGLLSCDSSLRGSSKG